MTSVSAPLTADEAVARARALVPALAERASQTEGLRRLPDETFADLVAAGLFRITQPKRFGGSELPLQYAFDIVSQLSQGCGSAGWTYSLLTAHEIILSHFPDAAQRDVWGANPDAVMSTCFAGGVPAEVTDGGYHIGEGLWRFSSGVHHASWVALLAPVPAEDGPRFLLIPKHELDVIDDWRSAGLAGTGSCSVHARNIMVPAHRTLRMRDLLGSSAPGQDVNTGPLYRMPLVGTWQVFMTGMAAGIARAALDSWITRTRNRRHAYTGQPVTSDPSGLIRLGSAAARIENAETIMRLTAERAMAEASATGTVAEETRARGRRDYSFALQLCVDGVEELFLASGASALDERSPIQRCWRDVHAVAQHAVNNIDTGYRSWAERTLGLGDGLGFT